MTGLPTLIVEGVQADQILDAPCEHADCGEFHLAGINTVRIDGPLPTVRQYHDQWGYDTRPLRVGDRVTLATMCADGRHPTHPTLFATATVAKVRVNAFAGQALVTVTEVEAL